MSPLPLRPDNIPGKARQPLRLLGFLLLCGWPVFAQAVPFRPDVLDQVRAQGRLPGIVTGIQAAERAGLDHPPATARGWLRRAEPGRAIPDRDAIVILVDFSDNQANQGAYPPSHYEAMLFSVGAYPTGSMRDWYLENSYGQFNVTGQVTIWLRMPQTYAYYVDGQAGFGDYPHNAQKLAEDAVVAANPFVDFSQFDNDGPDGVPHSGDDDGYVDALFVVHAGPGRETTGSDNDIHSHAWNMANAQPVDGVLASGYCMEPDEGKRGVFGHEFGHVLGLPDLYDTDYSSSGVGDWCMMSFGSWGGGGVTPVHFLSWCKSRLDFLDLATPLVNGNGSQIPAVETNPAASALWTGGYPGTEYFTVENRQRTGSDVSLPGDGLIICHIDESINGNTDENHPQVAVEQADGLNELHGGGSSDTGDPWPGSTVNRNFTDTSNPNSRDYGGSATQVAIRNVSNSSALMTADLQVETSPILVVQDYIPAEHSGNGNAYIDPGEEWDLTAVIYNRGALASLVSGVLGSTHPDVTILSGNTSFGTIQPESAVAGAPPFRVGLSGGSTTDAFPLQMTIQGLFGPLGQVKWVVGVRDSLEVFRWSHAPASAGYLDQWHISTQRNHTSGGSYSWKCGHEGAGNYADRTDAALVTRPLPLATVNAISFWHWIDAEDDANQTAWDGGIIEASVDGGPWSQITPDGGYPYTIIANPDSPFLPDTPCFSGTFDWSPVRVDLTGVNGQVVQLRFRFGSDGYVAQEGWYLDDFSVEGYLPSAAPGSLLSARQVLLSTPLPNPARGLVLFEFAQPLQQETRLSVVDVGGRTLRDWVFAPQIEGRSRRFTWDGRIDGGAELSSGVYFVRLQAGRLTRTERFVWVR